MELMFRLETLLQSGVQTRMSCDIRVWWLTCCFKAGQAQGFQFFFFKGVFPGCWQGSLKIKLTEPQNSLTQ